MTANKQDHTTVPGKNSAVFGRDDLLDEACRFSFLDPGTRNRYVVAEQEVLFTFVTQLVQSSRKDTDGIEMRRGAKHFILEFVHVLYNDWTGYKVELEDLVQNNLRKLRSLIDSQLLNFRGN